MESSTALRNWRQGRGLLLVSWAELRKYTENLNCPSEKPDINFYFDYSSTNTVQVPLLHQLCDQETQHVPLCLCSLPATRSRRVVSVPNLSLDPAIACPVIGDIYDRGHWMPGYVTLTCSETTQNTGSELISFPRAPLILGNKLVDSCFTGTDKSSRTEAKSSTALLILDRWVFVQEDHIVGMHRRDLLSIWSLLQERGPC